MAPALPPMTSSCLSAAISSSVNSARRRIGVGEQAAIVEGISPSRRAHRRSSPSPLAPPMPSERAKRARVAALEVLAQVRNAGERQFAGRLGAGRCRMRGEKNRDAGRAVVEVGTRGDELGNFGIAQPVEPDPGGGRAAANGVAGTISAAILSASAMKACFDGSARSLNRAARLWPAFAAAPPLGSTELVFSRITSICQAISWSSKFVMRSRARVQAWSGRRVAPTVPSASPISLPSLGDTKCGTFNASSAVRSARCSGHSGSAVFVPIRQPGHEVGLRRPDGAVVHAAMIFQPLQQHGVEAGRADHLADRKAGKAVEQGRRRRRCFGATEIWRNRQSLRRNLSIWSANLA